MAGRFAKKVGAKKLVLTHVSPRYPATRPDHPDMKELKNLAIGAFGSEEVVIANDLMRMDVSCVCLWYESVMWLKWSSSVNEKHD